MGKEENALTQRNAQAQISVSEQQLDAYRQHGVSEYSDERMAEGEQKKEEARARRQAERLRLRFAGLGETVEEPEESVSNANAGEQAVNAPQEMSERQKKKRDKRREKTLRRSRKQYGPGATENTLPMARRVAEYHKEREKAG
ncbi:MAG: hypothetical protein LBP30_03455, partial [Clostridiales Family XIII bacterium]|nr:hypothetical protein [Clostridiales Family XIII bacterium]